MGGRRLMVELELGPDPDETRRVALEAERDVTINAIETVEENASDEWVEHARATVDHLARTRASFFADDVWLAGLPKPSEARALGSIMLWAKTERLIAPTDQFLPSAQPGCHGVPRRVWKSLVFEGAP